MPSLAPGMRNVIRHYVYVPGVARAVLKGQEVVDLTESKPTDLSAASPSLADLTARVQFTRGVLNLDNVDHTHG